MATLLSDLRKMSDADIISGISDIVYTGEICRLEEETDCPKVVPGNDFMQLRELVDELEYRYVLKEQLNTQQSELSEEADPA